MLELAVCSYDGVTSLTVTVRYSDALYTVSVYTCSYNNHFRNNNYLLEEKMCSFFIIIAWYFVKCMIVLHFIL